MNSLPPVKPATVAGTPASREQWEQQYRSGGWDYLAGEDEAGHYLAIAQLCALHLREGSLLDVGCGAGILAACLQRHAGVEPSHYTGIDLAQEAVERAAAASPGASFSRLDYGQDMTPGQYDGVIFNETLYCFGDPLAIVHKCIAENMHAGSMLIISMYGDHHAPIWDALASRCDTVDERLVENSKGVRWRIRVLLPRSH